MSETNTAQLRSVASDPSTGTGTGTSNNLHTKEETRAFLRTLIHTMLANAWNINSRSQEWRMMQKFQRIYQLFFAGEAMFKEGMAGGPQWNPMNRRLGVRNVDDPLDLGPMVQFLAQLQQQLNED